jgi:hypothetical protein
MEKLDLKAKKKKRKENEHEHKWEPWREPVGGSRGTRKGTGGRYD